MTVKLPTSIFTEIERAARERRVPKSVIVRERLAGAAGAQSAPSLWSRMSDLTLDSDALPTDLSSNKAHFSGYGKNRSAR